MVRPANARAGFADAPPAVRVAQSATTASSAPARPRLRENRKVAPFLVLLFACDIARLRRVRVERVGGLVDAEVVRERQAECLAAERGREVGDVLRLTGCDPRDAGL